MAKQQISSLNITITGDATQLNNVLNNAANNLNNFNVNVNRNAGGRNNPFNRMGDDARRNQGFLDANLQALARYAQRLAVIYGTYKAFDFTTSFITDSVRLAAEAESAQVQFRVLLDSAQDAKSLLEDIVDFTEFTPFRLENTRQAARVLSAVGVEARRIMPTLRTLGDVAAGAGVPLLELAEVYAQTKEEGVVFTRDLRQFQRRAIPVTEELAKQFGVAKEEVRNLAQEGKISFGNLQLALASLTSETGRYAGLTAELAETTEGQYSNLLDEIDSLKREIGNGLLPPLTAAVVLAREFVQSWSEGSIRQDVQTITADLLTFASYWGQAWNEAQKIVLNMSRGMGLLVMQAAQVNDALFGTQIAETVRAINDEIENQLDLQDAQQAKWAELLDMVDEYSQRTFDPPEGDNLADFIDEITQEILNATQAAQDLKNELSDINAIERGSDADIRARRRQLFNQFDGRPGGGLIGGGGGGMENVVKLQPDPAAFRDLMFDGASNVPRQYQDIFSNIYEGLTADGLVGPELQSALTQQMNDFFRMIGAQINDLGEVRDNEKVTEEQTKEITAAQDKTTAAVNEMRRNLPRLIFTDVGL